MRPVSPPYIVHVLPISQTAARLVCDRTCGPRDGRWPPASPTGGPFFDPPTLTFFFLRLDGHRCFVSIFLPSMPLPHCPHTNDIPTPLSFCPDFGSCQWLLPHLVRHAASCSRCVVHRRPTPPACGAGSTGLHSHRSSHVHRGGARLPQPLGPT